MTHMVDWVLYKVANVTQREREGKKDGEKESLSALWDPHVVSLVAHT